MVQRFSSYWLSRKNLSLGAFVIEHRFRRN